MKNAIEDLVIFGGDPAFEDEVHVGRPNIGNRNALLARINDLLDRRWFTNSGRFVQEFEQRIADFLGVKHCVAICNGTVALEIAIRALGLHGEVIVPSFTFIATAHALQWQGITPVFCDLDPATHNLDPAKVEAMITPRTTGIIGVHVWGRPCAIEALTEISQRRGLTLMFDAAHAFGNSYKGRMIGNFGQAEIFSFHATKFFNTFEGGAIVTNYDNLAVKMRLMKNFGFAGYDNVIYIGTNGKMNEVAAAMGLTNLESFQEFISVNQRNYNMYKECLKGLPGITLIDYLNNEHQNYQYIVLEVDQAKAGLSRDELQQVLWAENVLSRRYFYPGCHRMEPYRSFFPHASLLLQETEKVADKVLIMPTGTSVGCSDIATICSIIHIALSQPKKIKDALSKNT